MFAKKNDKNTGGGTLPTLPSPKVIKSFSQFLRVRSMLYEMGGKARLGLYLTQTGISCDLLSRDPSARKRTKRDRLLGVIRSMKENDSKMKMLKDAAVLLNKIAKSNKVVLAKINHLPGKKSGRGGIDEGTSEAILKACNSLFKSSELFPGLEGCFSADSGVVRSRALPTTKPPVRPSPRRVPSAQWAEDDDDESYTEPVLHDLFEHSSQAEAKLGGLDPLAEPSVASARPLDPSASSAQASAQSPRARAKASEEAKKDLKGTGIRQVGWTVYNIEDLFYEIFGISDEEDKWTQAYSTMNDVDLVHARRNSEGIIWTTPTGEEDLSERSWLWRKIVWEYLVGCVYSSSIIAQITTMAIRKYDITRLWRAIEEQWVGQQTVIVQKFHHIWQTKWRKNESFFEFVAELTLFHEEANMHGADIPHDHLMAKVLLEARKVPYLKGEADKFYRLVNNKGRRMTQGLVPEEPPSFERMMEIFAILDSEERQKNSAMDVEDYFRSNQDKARSAAFDVRPKAKGKKVCEFFARGYCRKGEECDWEHVRTSGPKNSNRNDPKRVMPSVTAQGDLVCFKFMRNEDCDRRKCKFKHVNPAMTLDTWNRTHPKASNPKDNKTINTKSRKAVENSNSDSDSKNNSDIFSRLEQSIKDIKRDNKKLRKARVEAEPAKIESSSESEREKRASRKSENKKANKKSKESKGKKKKKQKGGYAHRLNCLSDSDFDSTDSDWSLALRVRVLHTEPLGKTTGKGTTSSSGQKAEAYGLKPKASALGFTGAAPKNILGPTLLAVEASAFVVRDEVVVSAGNRTQKLGKESSGPESARFLEESRTMRMCVDSGCTRVMTNDRADAWPGTIRKLEKPITINCAGEGQKLKAKEKCTIKVLDHGGRVFVMNDVLIVPELQEKLMGVPVLDKGGYSISMGGGVLKITHGDRLVARSKMQDHTYYADFRFLPPKQRRGEVWGRRVVPKYDIGKVRIAKTFRGELSPFEVYHNRLGHIGSKEVDKAYPDLRLGSDRVCTCVSCVKGKAHSFAFKSAKHHRIYQPGEKLHYDLGGPFYRDSQDHRYHLVCVDDASDFTWVRYLKKKSEAYDAITEIRREAKVQSGNELKVLYADRGGENMSRKLFNDAKRKGFKMEWAAPRAHAQAGKVERKNRTLDETVAALLMHAGAPARFWSWALQQVLFIHNNRPWKKNKDWKAGSKKPKWLSRKSLLDGTQHIYGLDNFRPFGCEAWGYIPKPQRAGGKSHLIMKARHGIMLGNDPESKAFFIWDVRRQKVFRSAVQHTVTDEESYPWRDRRLWTKKERRGPRDFVIPEIGMVTREVMEMYDLPHQFLGLDLRASAPMIDPGTDPPVGEGIWGSASEITGSMSGVESDSGPEGRGGDSCPPLTDSRSDCDGSPFSPDTNSKYPDLDHKHNGSECSDLDYNNDSLETNGGSDPLESEYHSEVHCDSGTELNARSDAETLSDSEAKASSGSEADSECSDNSSVKSIEAESDAPSMGTKGPDSSDQGLTPEDDSDEAQPRSHGHNTRRRNVPRDFYAPYVDSQNYRYRADRALLASAEEEGVPPVKCLNTYVAFLSQAIDSEESIRQEVGEALIPDPVQDFLQRSKLVALQAQPLRQSTGGYSGQKPVPMKRPKGMIAPKNLRMAKKDRNATEYLQAGVKEWNGLWENKTWHWVRRQDLPKGARVLPTMMVFDNKKDADGETIGAKARIVALGNLQGPGDYPEYTSATVMNSKTFKLCLALILVVEKTFTWHWDVSQAFVNAQLDEEIYVLPPDGYQEAGKVLKLDKALYGLVQAAFAWQKRLASILESIGCMPLLCDPATYYLREGKEFIIIPTHVDDLFPTTNSKRLLDKVWKCLEEHLTMKDLGYVSSPLKSKIEIDYKVGVIKISNTSYIDDILDKFRMNDCKAEATPAELDKPLTPEMWDNLSEVEQELNLEQYPVRSVVGSLWWLCQSSRPDIKEACQNVSRWPNCGRNVCAF